MPYIKKEDREKFDEYEVDELAATCTGPGELNYLLTRILVGYVEYRGESYATYNEVIGVLECAKMELARRRLSIYEDEKCKSNGDVY